jgi:hypothetical protein
MRTCQCLVFAAAVMLSYSGSARAGTYPWCAEFSWGGGTDCAYETLEQCLATVSGVGGMCRLNSWLATEPRYPGRRRH